MIKTALRVVITFGCSVVKKSRALVAFISQAGTFVTVVTAKRGEKQKREGISMPDVTHVKEGKTHYRQVFDPEQRRPGRVGLLRPRRQTSLIHDVWV